MGKLNKMDGSGHTTIEWEVGERSEREARTEFDRIVANGGLAYATTVEKGRPSHTQIREFDPQAEEITLHRQFAGG